MEIYSFEISIDETEEIQWHYSNSPENIKLSDE